MNFEELIKVSLKRRKVEYQIMVENILRRFFNFKQAGGSFFYLFIRGITFYVMPRQLLTPSDMRAKSPSARRINNLISSRTKSYLEIGMQNGSTFEQVDVNVKHGVEPYPRFSTKLLPKNVKVFKVMSDEFFEIHCKNTLYDFIFIDGSHELQQVGRDLLNSLNHLSDHGRILMDDMVPCDSISAIADTEISNLKRKQAGLPGKPNHGDCFRLLPFIFEHLSFMEIYLILYPNNPQLLLVAPPKYRDFLSMNEIRIAYESYNFSDLTYELVFESGKLKTYPIFIEELLINFLRNKK